MNKQAWQRVAESHVRLVALVSLVTKMPFTSNDVWAMGLEEPENSRWLGPVMQRLAREGVIVKVGEGVLSERGHGSRMNSMWLGA